MVEYKVKLVIHTAYIDDTFVANSVAVNEKKRRIFFQL